jgi:hypothetical protein
LLLRSKFWENAQAAAAEILTFSFSRYSSGNISNSDPYLLLNDQLNLPEGKDIKSKLISNAEEALLVHVQTKLSTAYDAAAVNNIWFNRPKFMSDETWNNISRNLNDGYKFLFLRDYILHNFLMTDSKHKFIDALPQLPKQEAKDLQNALDQILYLSAIDEMVHGYGLQSVIEKYTGRISDHATTDKLRNIASKLYIVTKIETFGLNAIKMLLEDPVSPNILDEDRRFLEGINTPISKSNEIISAIFKISNGLEMRAEEYRNLDNGDFSLLYDIADIVSQRNEIQKIKAQLANDESKLNMLITKINKQLHFINEFISDPGIIDRVEDYDVTFSKGNFENLRAIASISTKLKKE